MVIVGVMPLASSVGDAVSSLAVLVAKHAIQSLAAGSLAIARVAYLRIQLGALVAHAAATGEHLQFMQNPSRDEADVLGGGKGIAFGP